MSAQSSGPDIVDLWRKAEKMNALTTPTIAKTSSDSVTLTERAGVWANLSHMSPVDQSAMFAKLAQSWPYTMERRAISAQLHVGLIANGFTAGTIALRISTDMVLFKPKMRFLDAVREGPKSPWVFGVYVSGVTYFLMYQMKVSPLLFGEEEPCASCLLTRAAAVSLFTGAAMPMLATPYLAYYVLLNRAGDNYPKMANMLELLTMSWEGSKAARPMLKWVIPIQIIITACTTYIAMWGRHRMFGTLDSDPDLARDLMIRAQSQRGMKERVTDFLASIPLLGGVVKEQPPEEQRLKVR